MLRVAIQVDHAEVDHFLGTENSKPFDVRHASNASGSAVSKRGMRAQGRPSSPSGDLRRPLSALPYVHDRPIRSWFRPRGVHVIVSADYTVF